MPVQINKLKAIWNKRKGYAYLPISKSACSSFKKLIAADLMIEIADLYKIHRTKIPSILLTSVPLDFFLFTFVRNPWHRLVSCFRQKIVPGRDDEFYLRGVARPFVSYGFRADMEFEQFAKHACTISREKAEPHFAPQSRFIYRNEEKLVRNVYRLELLDQVKAEIEAATGLDLSQLGKVNDTGEYDYTTYYGPSLQGLVAEYYEADIRLFGYSFEGLVDG